MAKLKGLYVLNSGAFNVIYGPDEQRDIAELVDIDAPVQASDVVARSPELLREVDIIFSGWGGPRLDEAFLKASPRLKVVFYGAGAASGIVTNASWDRGVVVTTAYAANAEPVAEYTLAMILFGLKHGWRYAMSIREAGEFPGKWPVPGCYGSTVGLVSMGMVARLVRQHLRPFDLKVLAYDPLLPAEQAVELEVEIVSLDDLFRRSDVVSLHTPWLRETEGIISGAHIAGMKEGATFINTSRGAIVREPEMMDVASRRPDLQFFLDVTHPEPPDPGSPLYTLPNVMLTPHIAGSMDRECQRMGRYMVDELRRYVKGERLIWQVTRELAQHTSHRPGGNS